MRSIVLGMGLAASAALLGCGVSGPSSSGLLDQQTALVSDFSAQGIQIPNFAKVNDQLYRGGQPTASDLQGLAQMGVKTDVCLLGLGRNDAATIASERAAATSAGLQFVNIQVPFLTQPSQAIVDQFLKTVENPVNQPSFVHCHLGHDRTGAMVAAYRIQHDGWTAQQAITEMESYGYDPTRLPALEKFVLAYQPDQLATR